ncbi:acyl-CoA N-acyltransferase [Umbelopsis sp. PMI_123]|nr:acyl-CoA N-acyltransferase [Umbelopsis sp. PMI_123]
MAPSVSVRQCTAEEVVEYFYKWPRQEQWNPGADGYDLSQVYYRSDPNGFFLGTIEEDGSPDIQQVVSIISAVRYGKDSAWVGFYIVAPEYRGKGYGLATFQQALCKLRDRPCIGLDGVLQQVENYKKSGFTVVSWENERRSGSADTILEKLSSFETLEGKNMVNASDVPIEALNELEKRYNGWDRPFFVSEWIKFHTNNAQHGRFSIAVVEKGKVLGYGCVRPAITSFRVGPLFAESVEVAKSILYKLAKLTSEATTQPDSKIRSSVKNVVDVDVPKVNSQAVALFDELDMRNTFTTLRMWKGKQPEVDENGIYGVTTLEVG